MKFLSTFETAEKWGISHRRVSILCNQGRSPAHSGQEAVGSSRKMQRSPPMPESRVGNISKKERRKEAHNGWILYFYPEISDKDFWI